MWTEIKAAYRDSWKVALAYPLLFALSAAAEFAQHVAEYRTGMFASIEGMRAAAENGWRLGLGVLKIFILVLLLYWVSRALARLHGAALRVSGDAGSARLFAFVLAWGMGTSLLQLFGGDLIAPLVTNPRAMLAVGAVFALGLLVCDTYLSAWKVGAALGNARLSFTASFRIIQGSFWWSLGYFLLMVFPLLVLHYVLNGLAIGRPAPVMWAILGVDALIVGFLGIVLPAATYVIARRAAARKGEALLP